MPPDRINADKPHLWKADIAASVDQFNQWFMRFAPEAFRSTRVKTTEHVKAALLATRDLRSLDAATLKANPSALPTLRMCTAPPLAVDRLIGLAYASKNLVGRMEDGKLPMKLKDQALDAELSKLCRVLAKLLDRDIFPWLDGAKDPTDHERDRAATIVADRLCSAVANDLVSAAWKRHELALVAEYLQSRGYRRFQKPLEGHASMPPGTYDFGVTLPLVMGTYDRVSCDVLIRPEHVALRVAATLLDVRSTPKPTFTSTGRGADAIKLRELRLTYGESVAYLLMLGGSFDPGYLGIQAAEGLDWVWEHRLTDLSVGPPI
jgi:hypothetical protein